MVNEKERDRECEVLLLHQRGSLPVGDSEALELRLGILEVLLYLLAHVKDWTVTTAIRSIALSVQRPLQVSRWRVCDVRTWCRELADGVILGIVGTVSRREQTVARGSRSLGDVLDRSWPPLACSACIASHRLPSSPI